MRASNEGPCESRCFPAVSLVREDFVLPISPRDPGFPVATGPVARVEISPPGETPVFLAAASPTSIGGMSPRVIARAVEGAPFNVPRMSISIRSAAATIAASLAVLPEEDVGLGFPFDVTPVECEGDVASGAFAAGVATGDAGDSSGRVSTGASRGASFTKSTSPETVAASLTTGSTQSEYIAPTKPK